VIEHAGGPLDEATATRVGTEIAATLEFLHSLTPPVLCRRLDADGVAVHSVTGRAVLTAFEPPLGSAPFARGSEGIGAQGYAAPESFAGRYGEQSEVYSLGALLFYALTGSDPCDNPMLVFDFAKNPSPCELNPSLSHEIGAIVARAVAFQPEERYPSASAMRLELEQHGHRIAPERAP